MVDVLRRRSFGEEFGSALGAGIGQGLSQAQANALSSRQAAQENEAVKRLAGIDISGLQDPKARAKALEMAMQGAQQERLLGLKGQQKQDFLSQIFGGQRDQGQQQSPQDMLAAAEQSQQQGMLPQGFDASMITDAQIAQASALDPNIGRSLQHSKDVALREKREAEKLELAKLKTSPEFQRQQHLESSQAQSDVKYNQELQAAAKQHELKTQTLNKLEKLNKQGVTGKPYEKLLEKFGLVNLTSEGRREFAADVKNLITDIRSILGGQFSQFEFQTILNAYPSADFSKEANSAIIKNLQEFQEIRNKEFEIAKEIKKENKGKIPFDFQSQVNERLDQYVQSKLPDIKQNTMKIMNEEYGIPAGNTLMFDPQGEPLNVPESDIARFLEMGASLP